MLNRSVEVGFSEPGERLGARKTANERTLSEFLQHSGRLLPDLEEGEVILRRRDGEDLVLMTASQSEALHSLARTFLTTVGDNDLDAAARALPWIDLLSDEDQRRCVDELRAVTSISLDSGRIGRLAATFRAWEASALAAWDERENAGRTGYSIDSPLGLDRPS